MSSRTSMRGLALAALAALALPAAHAQNAERPAREAMQERHVERVQQRLDLTAQQAGLVEQALTAREPGALWAAAAALAPTLSDDQRARLTVPPERATEADRPARQRSDRPGRADRPNRAGRPDQAAPDGEVRREARERPDRRDHYEAMKTARNAALGLRAEQVAALDRMEVQQREAMQERRTQRDAQPDAPRTERRPLGPMPEEVAEILDDEQETIWLVHRALSPQFRGRPGHGGH